MGEAEPGSRVQKILFAAAALTCISTALVLLTGPSSIGSAVSTTELLGQWEEPHGIGIDEEPWSAPKNLWLYWGSTTNRRFTGSGEKIRHSKRVVECQDCRKQLEKKVAM